MIRPREDILFFLRPRWVAWYAMISGLIVTGYSFVNVLRYGISGDISPLFFGRVPMAFSTACLLVLVGLAIFWNGWLIRQELISDEDLRRLQGLPLTSNQVFQLTLAVISALSLIIVALIAALKK